MYYGFLDVCAMWFEMDLIYFAYVVGCANFNFFKRNAAQQETTLHLFMEIRNQDVLVREYSLVSRIPSIPFLL